MADIDGTPGNDVITGTDGPDVINGGDGNDIIISGGEGDDLIHGDAGNDSLIDDGRGPSRLFGGDGDDSLFMSRSGAQSGTIVMDGGGGDDLPSFFAQPDAYGLDLELTGGRVGIVSESVTGGTFWLMPVRATTGSSSAVLLTIF